MNDVVVLVSGEMVSSVGLWGVGCNDVRKQSSVRKKSLAKNYHDESLFSSTSETSLCFDGWCTASLVCFGHRNYLDSFFSKCCLGCFFQQLKRKKQKKQMRSESYHSLSKFFKKENSVVRHTFCNNKK